MVTSLVEVSTGNGTDSHRAQRHTCREQGGREVGGAERRDSWRKPDTTAREKQKRASRAANYTGATPCTFIPNLIF